MSSDNYTPPKLVVLAAEQNHRCGYCGVVFIEIEGHPDSPTTEHVLPRCDGGKKEWDNEIAACWTCNNGRGRVNAIAFFYMVQEMGRERAVKAARRMGAKINAAMRIGSNVYVTDKEGIDRTVLHLSMELLRKKFPEMTKQRRDRGHRIVAPQFGVETGKGAKARQALQDRFVGHGVYQGEFGSKRLPNVSTPAIPVEGASLGSIFPQLAALLTPGVNVLPSPPRSNQEMNPMLLEHVFSYLAQQSAKASDALSKKFAALSPTDLKALSTGEVAELKEAQAAINTAKSNLDTTVAAIDAAQAPPAELAASGGASTGEAQA